LAEPALQSLSGFSVDLPPAARSLIVEDADPDAMQHPLGAARAHLHETYILSQTADGLILVDAHAAHERLVYERLKAARGKPDSQMMLIPTVVELSEDSAGALIEIAPELAAIGLVIEPFGPGGIAVSEVPSSLAARDTAPLIHDLAASLESSGRMTLEARLDHVLKTIACHHSVRSGRRLKPEEMNALLREMEATPGSGTCNHGRPTYVELKLHDIESLFGRR
jgi:DNA mismatch repair protein MutL